MKKILLLLIFCLSCSIGLCAEDYEEVFNPHTGRLDKVNKGTQGIGTPTYDSIPDVINTTLSSGYTSGGDITDNLDGTVAVAAGTGYIRAASADTSTVYAFDFSADASVPLTADALNYVYASYDSVAGATIHATTALSDLDHTRKFVIGLAWGEASYAHIVEAGQKLNNFIHKVYYHSWEHDGIERASGLVTSEDAGTDLALNVTAGVLYWALERITVSALDTSGADTFKYLYYNGAAWVTVAAQTIIDNLQYNNVATGLATLTAGRYGVHWVFVTTDGELYIVYGQGNYTLAQAQAETIPTSLPSELQSLGVFIAKILVLKSATDFYSVSLPWTSQIGLSAATDHGGLAGLADDDHTQYLLTDGTRMLTGNWSAGGKNITSAGSVVVNSVGALTVGTGSTFTFGTTQWNSADEFDGTKVKDASYGDVSVGVSGDWYVLDDSHSHVITNIDSFTSAQLATQITDEIGTGNSLFGTRSGNTSTFGTTKGTLTSGNCVQIDADGNLIQAAGACGIAGAGLQNVQDEGLNLTARQAVNFKGDGVRCVDDGTDSSDCTISGNPAKYGVSLDAFEETVNLGTYGYSHVKERCSISNVVVMSTQSGTASIDLWVDDIGSFPPTDADSVCGTTPIHTVASKTSYDNTLTGWTKTMSAGDVIAYNVDSNTTHKNMSLIIECDG